MIHIGSLREAARTRQPFYLDGKLLSHKSHVIVAPDLDPESPNAFLIEQEPAALLAVHFHGHAQFQVVVAGGGTLGSHMLQPVMVHYAGQRTPYGPILPGPAGLWYLTLRPRYEAGAYFMPQSRDLRDRAIPRREVFGAHVDTVGRSGVVSCTVAGLDEVVPPEADGLGAWLMRLPAGTKGRTPARLNSAGRYHVVVGGSCEYQGQSLDWLSIIWADAGEAGLDIQAGAAGLELLVLEFPVDALAHGLPDRNPVAVAVATTSA
jgi:hypothetical protein